MAITKPELLAKYGLTPEDCIGQGMESVVFRYGTDSVLKVYDHMVSLAHLQILQDFYATLDRAAVPFALPAIRSIAAEDPYIVTIEQHLPGTPMADILPPPTPYQLDDWFESYIDTVLELGRIPMPDSTTRYKLFDPHQISHRTDGDWHHFLQRYLTLQLTPLADYFARDVVDFSQKRQRMEAVLARPYTGPYRLIHGDIFPGNILVSATGRTESLLDFGLVTMYGDPYFDLATSWVFFDMYDQLQANIRERLLTRLIAKLGEQARPKLYRYVLLYSLLSANTYAPDCTDGHYEWCVANLNTETYWKHLAEASW